LEASALTHASHRGLLARRSPLLKLQGDEKLIAMARAGNAGAFETIVDRYQGRLLGFCRQMLGSTEDAEDVLQEVFVNAYRAMLADEREINLRPWLYRIARNRCLNHLRKPHADAQESMDMVPAVEASSTAEKVHNREEFRQILSDVNKLPETQRSALLLREMDALSYEEIAAAMDTTVPSVKSLLVRARISLAEASQARLLTCGEVRVEISEAAEGLRKVSAPVRRHVRECEECAEFRSQLRSNEKALAALFPVGPLVAFKGFIASKLGLTGAGAGGAGAASAGAASAGAGAVGGVGAAIGGSGAASGIGGAIGGAIGTKAVAGVVTAAVLTAGAAAEVNQNAPSTPATPQAKISRSIPAPAKPQISSAATAEASPVKQGATITPPPPPPPPVEEEAEPAPPPAEAQAPAPQPVSDDVAGSSAGEEGTAGGIGASDSEGLGSATPSDGSAAGAPSSGAGTVVVTVGGTVAPPPAEATPPAESPPAESPPPAEAPAAPVETTPPATPAETEAETEPEVVVE
jgi:RNA polymerase sigma factor (sigma-70 family)